MTITFATMKDTYADLVARAEIKPQWKGAYERAAAYIMENRERYEGVSKLMDIPWQLVGCLHWREASGSFAGVLHNGEKILGTGRKTRLEPRGRGPFRTWEEAAADAIKIKTDKRPPEWSLEGVAWFAENFNGLGYLRYHPGVNSPYLWAGTTVYKSGKYYADGKYSASMVDQQLGVMPLYEMLLEKTKPADVRVQSRKINVIDYTKKGIGAVITTVGGWFTMDNFGLAQQALPALSGVFTLNTLIALLLAGGAFWLILNVLDKMIMEDAAEGRYTPSGQEVEDARVA